MPEWRGAICECILRSPAALTRRNHNKSFTRPTSSNDGRIAYKLDFTVVCLCINVWLKSFVRFHLILTKPQRLTAGCRFALRIVLLIMLTLIEYKGHINNIINPCLVNVYAFCAFDWMLYRHSCKYVTKPTYNRTKALSIQHSIEPKLYQVSFSKFHHSLNTIYVPSSIQEEATLNSHEDSFELT